MEDRSKAALAFLQGGVPDGDHHKAWIIDQLVRILTGCPIIEGEAEDSLGVPYTYSAIGENEEYRSFLAEYEEGEDGPHT